MKLGLGVKQMMIDNSQKEAIDEEGKVYIMSRKSTKKKRAGSRVVKVNRPTPTAATNVKKDAWDFD